MGKNLITRSEFARRANVGATAISKACKGILAPCLEGIKIDVNHPVALEYLRSHAPENQPVEPASGIDPLYEKAVAAARKSGDLSIRGLKRDLKIGTDRARELVRIVEATGVLKKPATPVVRFNESGKVVLPLSTTLGGETFRNKVETYNTEQTLQAPDEDDSLPMPAEFHETGIGNLADYSLRDLVLKFGTAERFKVWLQSYKSLVDIGAKEIANAEKRGQLVPRDFVDTHIIGAFNRTHINLLTDGSQTIARQLHIQFKAGATVEEAEVYVSDQISRHVREAKDNIVRILRDA